jgi:hypothetical protein
MLRTAARMGAVMALASGVALLAAARPAWAADVIIAAGAEYTLTGDIVLTGSDVFQAGDPAGPRCKIHGGNHAISTDTTWSSTFTMSNCDVDALGVAGSPAISVATAHDVTIVGSTFSTSSQILVTSSGDMTVTFNNNTIAEDSIVTIDMTSLDHSQDAFHATGGSTGMKLFQGNRILRSRAAFDLTDNWLIGGDTPAQGNVFAGFRGGIFISRTGPMTVRGNYSHPLGAGWNQVKNLSIFSPGGAPILVEHNVFIGNDWNTEMNNPGEIRYNLFVNPHERGWIQTNSGDGLKIHHNLLIQTADSQWDAIQGGFVILQVYDATATPLPIEIYNNTLDSGGNCNPGNAGGMMMSDVIGSLRSNAFIGFRLAPWTGTALIGTSAKTIPSPLPPLLGYTDYNLFYNPDPSVKANYNVGVAGKTLRTDPGFAYHDVPVGGAPDVQTPPKFANQTPHLFPFGDGKIAGESGLAMADQMVVAGTLTVCQILAYYRQAYLPAADSPLVDAGDPQEGGGNDIGAVGAGVDNSLDLFGKLCDPSDIGSPLTSGNIFQCNTVAIQTGGGTGGGGSTGGVPGSHSFVCVCQSAGTAGDPWAASIVIAAAAGLAATRRRRRSATRGRGLS